MKTKIVKIDDSKETIKERNKIESAKKKAVKSILEGKGFILINITKKGKFERFVNAGLKPNEVFSVIKSFEEISLDLIETLRKIPCDCPSCKNKFSGVN